MAAALNIGIFAALLILTGLITVCPAGSVKVSLFLDIVASNAGVVIILHIAALRGETIDNADRHSWVTLAYVLVAVASQCSRVATKATHVRLQTLHHQFTVIVIRHLSHMSNYYTVFENMFLCFFQISKKQFFGVI